MNVRKGIDKSKKKKKSKNICRTIECKFFNIAQYLFTSLYFSPLFPLLSAWRLQRNLTALFHKATYRTKTIPKTVIDALYAYKIYI